MDRPPRPDLDFLKRVHTLFDSLVDLAPSEHAALLERQCGTDEALKAEVRSLLRAATQSEHFLEALDGRQVAQVLAGGESVVPGTRLGPYAVVRELGRGGMGVVYLASRVDGNFQQEVALKLLKRGMDSEAILAGFLRERQILAWLQHENIARLYDGGLSEDGRPWFAMEYVDGLPVTQYCDQHRLSVPQRLELFRKACAAIQYAHQNLVIHRDLKPSNVLVTQDGQLKLLDFGIAKLLGESAQGATLTALGARAMTPEYAAPEQLRGEAVTTATDVHALGVLLYELLTGRRPYRWQSTDPLRIAQLVGVTETMLPSRAVLQEQSTQRSADERPGPSVDEVGEARSTRPRQLQRLLEGDLDTIILKAMHKEPERRYATVDALGEDLRRHLAGLPVLAQRDRWTYRASKFVRRNRWPVIASGGAAGLLIAFSLLTSVQRAQTARERDRAESVKDFVVGLLESTNPLQRGSSESELLQLGVERVATEFADEPIVQAELYLVIGAAQLERGQFDVARQALQRSLALRTEQFGRESLEVADVLGLLAAIERRTKNLAAAEPLYREVLATRKRHLGDRNLEVASALNDLAALLYSQTDYAAAEPLYRESLAIKRDLLGDEHEEIAISLGNLALLLRDRGDLEAAENLMREALDMKRRVFGPEHPTVASSIGGLATILSRQAKYADAEPYYSAAYTNRRANLGDTHPNTALALQNAALNDRNSGELARARLRYRDLLFTVQRDSALSARYLLETWNDLGSIELALGHVDRADSLFALAGRDCAKSDSTRSLYCRIAETGHAAVLLARRRQAEAIPLLRVALAVPANGPKLARRHELLAQSYLGAALSLSGHLLAADSLLTRAHAELRGMPLAAFEMARTREQLIAHYERHGRGQQAASLR